MTDAALMALALALARAAEDDDEVPVGAVVALDGAVVGRGRNRTLRDGDPTAHAEVVALREAAAAVGTHRLTGSTLVTTLEPCLMCCGAAVHARVGRLVFAATDEKAGATATLAGLAARGKLHHEMRVEGGLEAAASSEILRAFFRARRG